MDTMNAIDRHLSSEAAPGNHHIIAGENPGGLLHAAARDGSQPGSDGWTLLVPPWLMAAMVPARRRASIAWCAGGFPARRSTPNAFHRRPNR